MSKHIARRWEATENPHVKTRWEVRVAGDDRDSAIIAVLKTTSPAQAKAHAHLIAAAPELLEALIALSRALEPFHSGSALLSDINALIAKAEGRDD